MITRTMAIEQGVCRHCSGLIHEPPPNSGLKFDSIVDDESQDEFGHLSCIKRWQEDGLTDIDVENLITVANNVGELKELIDKLPSTMPIMLDDGKRKMTPVFAVERDRLTGYLYLEIRK